MTTLEPLAATIPTMPLTPRVRRATTTTVPCERIVLTGFMGSGKTTVGRRLAAELGWQFLDLDEHIEQREGSSVPAIFAELGEAAFRKCETAALAAALRMAHAVIALGGGAPETLGNRLLLEQTPATAVVFLSAPFATLHHRCVQQAAGPAQNARPVLADIAAAEARFAARQPLYRRLAHATVDTESATLDQTIAAVLAIVTTPRII